MYIQFQRCEDMCIRMYIKFVCVYVDWLGTEFLRVQSF